VNDPNTEVDLGSQIIPYTRDGNDVYGTYRLNFIDYNKICTVSISSSGATTTTTTTTAAPTTTTTTTTAAPTTTTAAPTTTTTAAPLVGYTLSGSEDFSGNYTISGTYNGEPVWQHETKNYVLSFSGEQTGWAAFPGTIASGPTQGPMIFQACGYPCGGNGTCTVGDIVGDYCGGENIFTITQAGSATTTTAAPTTTTTTTTTTTAAPTTTTTAAPNFSPTAVVLTSGSSYTVPAGATMMKAWAIGGAGGYRNYCDGGANAMGGNGAVAVRTYFVSGGQTLSYSIGAGDTAECDAERYAGGTTVTYGAVSVVGGGGISRSGANNAGVTAGCTSADFCGVAGGDVDGINAAVTLANGNISGRGIANVPRSAGGAGPDVGGDGAVVLYFTSPTGPAVPLRPRNVATQSFVGRERITWSAPNFDGGSTITGYRVRSGGTLVATNTVIAGTTIDIIHTACYSDGATYVSIAAINSVGESPAVTIYPYWGYCD
jgi:septal ring-binding cell division protein DamX